jgi:uncharacterized protein (TIGR00661 family)
MPAESEDRDDVPLNPKRILVAPLNWGLGHVSRCIPIIRALESLGVEVLLASDGAALHLLKAEFPHLKAFTLPSYKIKYFSHNMAINIARQLPRILYAIRAEQWQTERIVQSHKIDGIISDNRYGCFSNRAHSVMLSHQLNLRAPQKVLQWAANKALRRALAKFEEIWVPDAQIEPNLSGELSHPAKGSTQVRYIGLLSSATPASVTVEQEYDVAVVLSGPEPQRTYLEQILLEQAMLLPEKFIFIRGKTQSKEHHFAAENVEMVSYLTSGELNEVLQASGAVICRSGYSSLMDLAIMGKPAILIPTPGQTEQEYLADHLSRQKLFVVQEQDKIDLELALEQVRETKGLAGLQIPINEFEEDLKHWLTRIA